MSPQIRRSCASCARGIRTSVYITQIKNERKTSKSFILFLKQMVACHARNSSPSITLTASPLLYLRSFAFICGLFFAFNALPVLADTTPQSDIRNLDRMFTTRFERAQLDAQRRRMSSGEVIDASANTGIVPEPVNVEMQGIMQREKGSTVTWINGQSTLNSNTIDANIRVQGQPKALSGANVAIGGQTVRLKPGQVWQPEDNKVVERYKTKVAAPVTKGTDEAAAAVQTKAVLEGVVIISPAVEPKPEPAKADTTQPKP